MRPALCLSALLLGGAIISGSSVAAEPQATAARVSSDEAAVRSAATAYRQALDKKDVDAVTAYWTPDADYVDQLGRVYKIHAGLALAKKLSQEAFHLAHLAPQTETLTVRFVTPDVAIEDGSFERIGSLAGPAPQGRYTAVWVKREGRWLIDGVRESPVRVEDSTVALDDLGWLIGDWVAEGPHVSAEISCSWGQDQSFIVTHLKMRPATGEPFSSTQLIGWDPKEQRIRSFMFDSRGGFNEGVWTNEGDGWVVKSAASHPNGKRTTSTKIYSRIDENTAIWESIDDDVAGEPTVDLRLRITRKPTKK
ncbi:MAG TPA: nuclear transport factor 2 family protein [Pirellulales bacterium]|jgi:uncharacterized protein (TIGR02246 family)